FFFQAEDGIRAGHVTGVQTCALPISQRCFACPCSENASSKAIIKARASKASLCMVILLDEKEAPFVIYDIYIRPAPTLAAPIARSEERRVGKECRWCGSRDD